jgi:predicted TIM-barrel fold metal-dependent hydrolase
MDQIMDGYEPPLPDPIDYAVPKDFRMVDAHVHWWDHADKTVTWGVASRNWQHPRLMWAWRLDQERFSAPEYRAESSGLVVIKVVHVQHASMATPSAVETAWLQSVADRYDWPNAIIARGLLADTSPPKDLQANAAYANFRGVRDCSEMELIGTPQWIIGYKALLALGGICELMITHEHFEAAYQVAKQFPDKELMLCHAGIPVVSKLDDYQHAWRTALRKLAKAPNVIVKISGLSSGSPANFYAVTMRQWIRQCVETFGPERCMFGSNFHVERLFVTLPKLFRTYRRALEDYTLTEQDRIFAGTAERVYRI